MADMQQIYFKELSLQSAAELLQKSGNGGTEYQGEKILVKALWKRHNLRCSLCDRTADRWVISTFRNDKHLSLVLVPCISDGGAIDILTKDHIIPLSLGGKNRPTNYRVACCRCNVQRGNNIEADIPWIRKNLENINIAFFKKSYEQALRHCKGIKKKEKRDKILLPYRQLLEVLVERRVSSECARTTKTGCPAPKGDSSCDERSQVLRIEGTIGPSQSSH